MSRSTLRKVKPHHYGIAFIAVFAAIFFYFGEPAPVSSQVTPTTTTILTTGSTWNVPTSWNSSFNTIEVIGGGAGGNTSAGTGGGGGGGAYSRITNATLTPGSTITVAIGAGGGTNISGGDTYVCNSTSNCASISDSAVIVGAKGGTTGANPNGGIGGAAANGVGTLKYSGGNGGLGPLACGKSGGGGGAAGPRGSGGNGGIGGTCNQPAGSPPPGGGGGGGGNGGGGAGLSGQAGGTGGTNNLGTGSGAAGTTAEGQPGLYGGGGGGGAPGTFGGGAGGAGIEWVGNNGSGGGGGGKTGGGNSGNGGLYGGGGGGGTGGNGAQGIIVITFAPITPPTPQCAVTSGGTPLTGYAWSDNVGWISLSCSNDNSCGTSSYGIQIASNGTMSGCAWNDNVGWITTTAADLTSCPSGTCNARMNDLAMEGWMKALSSSDAQSGGWDGFISLSGASYGATLNATTGVLSGYAWGDMNVGWVGFNSAFHTAQTTWRPACASQYSCTNSTTRQNACTGSVPEVCASGLACIAGACPTPAAPSTAPGDALTVDPRLVRTGNTSLVTWDVADATSCTVTENSSGISDSWSGINSTDATCATHSGAACRTSPIRTTTTYTLSCTGLGGNLTQSATVYTTPSFKEI